MPSLGRFEVIRETGKQSGGPEEDYWQECFTWPDLKKIVPALKAQGWRVTVEPVSREEIFGRIHIFSFTCGINHDFRIRNIAGIRIIIARDFGIPKILKESFTPAGS